MMDASLRYGGNDLPLVTGTDRGLQVQPDVGKNDQPLLYFLTGRAGEDLTVEMAEVLGRALLAWAADMRLVSP